MEKIVIERIEPDDDKSLERLNAWFQQLIARAFSVPVGLFDTSKTRHFEATEALLSDAIQNGLAEHDLDRVCYAWHWYVIALKAYVHYLECQM